MTEVAANFTGSIPENYDRYLGPIIFSDYAEDLAARVAATGPNSVLELAAGTGILSRKLRNILPDHCALLITDLNPPMLDTAKCKFGPDDNVTFETANAGALPFDDCSFDVTSCQFGVMFFPDKQKHFSEVWRTLKPGGSYIFSVWGSWEFNPFAKIAHQTVAEIFPDNPPGFYKVPFGYFDVTEIRDTLLAAGFSNVESEIVSLNSNISSMEDFARGLVYGNPLIEEILARGGDPEYVHRCLSNQLVPKLGSSMPLQAVIIQAS